MGMLRLPESVRFGQGARTGLARAVAALGRRAFIVADPFLSTSRHFTEIVSSIESVGVVVQVYTEVLPELPVDSLTVAADTASAFRPEVIVGYGGGSTLDAAKLVALLVAHGGPLSKYYGENAVPDPVLPLVAVPTTAGTGSEVTPVAVISDPNQETKVGISSPHLIPRVAVVDPELTIGAPAGVTAHSGIDALVHAVESYTAADLPLDWTSELPVFVGRNALTAALSLDAIRHIGPSLAVAVHEPGDVHARSDMAYGSLVAGMAFGSTGTHLSHALQYPIGALTKTPHGLGTGMMLPYVLEVCRPVAADRIAEIGRALGGDGDVAGLATGTIDRIADLCAAIGLPASLEEIGISRADLPRIAALAMKSKRLIKIAPLDIEPALLLEILEAAYVGDRSLLRASR